MKAISIEVSQDEAEAAYQTGDSNTRAYQTGDNTSTRAYQTGDTPPARAYQTTDGSTSPGHSRDTPDLAPLAD